MSRGGLVKCVTSFSLIIPQPKENMKTPSSRLLAATLAALTLSAEALTIREPDRYYTDFRDTSVTNDFCIGAMARFYSYSFKAGMETVFNPAAGTMMLQTLEGRPVGVALVSCGKQWNPPEVVVGRDIVLNQDITGEPYGVFRDTVATATYSIQYPTSSAGLANFNLHTNINIMLFARKSMQPDGNNLVASPYANRRHHYFTLYDGKRFALCEYTGSGSGNYREIAAQDIAISDNKSLFKVRISVKGGSDGIMGVTSGNWWQTDESPAEMEAHFWENGNLIASLSGRDNPFNWYTGPEPSEDYSFDPAGDWNNGSWTNKFNNSNYPADWWSPNSLGRYRNNRSISTEGWTGIVYAPGGGSSFNAGNTAKIFVHSFEVVPSLTQPTLLFLK